MEVIAESKAVHISPRKVRLVADSVRNLPVVKALEVLMLVPKRASLPIEKTILSAVANAVHNNKLQQDQLVVARIEIGEGPVLKRFRPSTRGRVHPYKKRTSHIRVVVKEKGGKN